jgi:UDP-N-acetylglucosamine 2-epimerase (non-hydrolysing)
MTAIDGVVDRVRPDWLLVQGDTTTAMISGLAAFHRRIRVGHIEAGLRTGDLDRPFPEEANRKIVDTFAAALFAPTARAARALADEGVPADRIYLTGNTVVDALESVAARIGREARAGEVLITAHRRESFGPALRAMFGAVADLAERFPDIRWIFPVHPNPSVRDPAHEALGSFPNIELHEPFDYEELIRRLMRARLVLTDSGGIQEEAPAFGTPVLVMRERTERPEGVEAGVARLVGVDRETIVAAATEVLRDPATEQAMGRGGNPYGDGHAAERITSILAGEPWEPFRAPARLSTECV